MNGVDIVLLNLISYMGGLLTGLGFCFKYKKHFLVRTSSHEQLSQIINSIHSDISSSTSVGPTVVTSAPQPVIASAPHSELVKEVVIRTN